MTKTDNEKYVKRGADMFIEYNPEWEDEVRHANKGKVGAPYRYPETLIMPAAALRVGMDVRYGQLEGAVGKMIRAFRMPFFSQIRKRMGRLDVSTYQSGMITVPAGHTSGWSPEATWLDMLNRGEKRESQTCWKARIVYSMRRVAERAFSTFKRVFGEHVMSLAWENIIQEMRLKVALYSKWRDESIARELGGACHT